MILSSSNWIGKPDGAILLGAISSLSGAVEPIEIEMKPPKVDLDIVGSCWIHPDLISEGLDPGDPSR